MGPSRVLRSLKFCGVERAPLGAPIGAVGRPVAKGLRRRLVPVGVAALLIVVPGCKADTCSGGQNMTNPRVVGEFSAAASPPTLRIGWDAGTKLGALLPDAYFEDVVVSWGGAGALIEEVSLSSERELTVVFSSLGEPLAERDELGFTLEFPDRAAHTSCAHGGMSDQYLLDVILHLDASGTLASADFTQRVLYGAY